MFVAKVCSNTFRFQKALKVSYGRTVPVSEYFGHECGFWANDDVEAPPNGSATPQQGYELESRWTFRFGVGSRLSAAVFAGLFFRGTIALFLVCLKLFV